MAKRQENGEPLLAVTRVLILHETDCHLVFNVSTDEQLYRISLMIVNARRNAGHYPTLGPEPKPDLYPNTVRTLPASLQDYARKKLNDFREEARRYESAKIQYDRLTNLIDSKNGEEAHRFMFDRRHFEGEDFSIVDIVNDYQLTAVAPSDD